MKNRFMFALLQNLRSFFKLQLLTWSFFATSHGKGPVDAVGGMVKRIVWRCVLSRRIDAVSNAQQFVQALQTCDSSVQPILSTPVSEASALEDVGAPQLFLVAPKVAHISQDHFWRCDAIGTERKRYSKPEETLPLEVEMLDLDLPEMLESDDEEYPVLPLFPVPDDRCAADIPRHSERRRRPVDRFI